LTARKGANLPQRGYVAGARSKAIFRKNFACSSPTPNTTQAAAHLSVTAGRNALGTIEQVAGGFVATSAGGMAIHHEWCRDAGDRITAPDSGRWVCIDRWRDWVLWRRISLEGAAS
jgi:hypothetical protein